MRAQDDNATTSQESLRGGLSEPYVTPAVTSPYWLPCPSLIGVRQLPAATLTDGHVTLGDGHTMPSIFAATPSPSTKVEKLMDTLFRDSSAPINVTSRCYVSRFERASWLLRAESGRNHRGLFSTRVLRKESRKFSSINKSAKTSRHTFDMFGTQRGGLSRF
jgi:hypothetical protein